MIHDARARQRRHRAGAAIVLAAAAAGALLLASGGSGAGRGISHRPAHRRPPGRQAAGGAQLRPVVVMRGLRRSAAYAADGSLYVTQQLNAYGLAPVDALWRVSPASGRIRASRPLDGTFSQALMASGSLWVTSTSGARSWLWRLDPASLAVDERLLLGSNGDGSGEAAPTLTAAGGWLWIGDLDRLIRVSSATGAVTETIHVPGAGGIGVASNPSGGVLLDSEGRQIAHIQRRDPRTGRLLRQSAPIGSVSFPYVGGVYGDSVWVSNATGMAGYVQRFSLATLKPTRFAGAKPHPGVTMPPAILGANGIRAQMLDGILWVTQPAGGRQLNYCANPLNGATRASLQFGPEAQLLTAGAGHVYYVQNAQARYATLDSVRISPRC